MKISQNRGVELLKEVVELAKQDDALYHTQENSQPRRWVQETWAAVPYGAFKEAVDNGEKTIGKFNIDSTVLPAGCGTTGCIAGWAVMLTGHRLAVTEVEGELAWMENEEGLDEAYIMYAVDGEGEVRYISELAAELLGLGLSEAWKLFSGENTVEDIVRISDEIIARESRVVSP